MILDGFDICNSNTPNRWYFELYPINMHIKEEMEQMAGVENKGCPCYNIDNKFANAKYIKTR